MKHFVRLVLALSLLAGGTAQASAGTICLLDGRGPRPQNVADCQKVTDACGSSSIVLSPPSVVAVALGQGTAQTPVDAYGRCRFLDNAAKDVFFVPFGSQVEWVSFLAGKPDEVSAVNCARPFNGKNDANGLYIGKTTVNTSMGDTGDPDSVSVSLPYWRTGSSWPPSSSCANTQKVFNHSCYEEVSTPKCWKWVSQTCKGSTCKGEVCTEYSYDCSYCADNGSICEKRWYSWSETFDFVATALDSDTQNPSWRGTSKRIAGSTRPSQCSTRCNFNGHDCVCPNCVPTGATSCNNGRKIDSCGHDIGECSSCCPYWGCQH